MSDPQDNIHTFRTPVELSVTVPNISRWLVIGSCLASGFTDIVSRLPNAPAGDYIIFNNAAQLPASPPHPISDYGLIFIQIPLRSVVRDLAHARLAYDDVDGFEELFSESVARLELMFEAATRYTRESRTPTVVSTLIAPQMSSIGRILGGRDLRCFTWFVERLNDRLASLVVDLENAFLLEIGPIIGTYGNKYFQDDFLWQLNHAAAVGDNDLAGDQGRLHPVVPISRLMPLRPSDFVIAMWHEIEAIWRTVTRVDAVKLVIFDLDDTLWRGVVAELDDPDPVSVEGWPLGIAEAALYLKQRGVVIAIASKNDEQRVRAVWEGMWQGRLRLEDFAILQINWHSKAENVAEIIKAVNVLPESVVFVDDNPVEREQVIRAIPGIRTLGSQLYDMRRILMWSAETQPAVMTSESARRGEMIQAQALRETARSKAIDRAEFLTSLAIRQDFLTVESVDDPKFDRALELLNKTNQFNTTGHRWTLDEIKSAFARGMRITAFEVEDKFTPYGLVGMALLEHGNIVQFVMSCRVIGLDVELACLDHIKAQHDRLVGHYTETGKNFLCSDLFARAGFAQAGDSWVWQKPLSDTDQA